MMVEEVHLTKNDSEKLTIKEHKFAGLILFLVRYVYFQEKETWSTQTIVLKETIINLWLMDKKKLSKT